MIPRELVTVANRMRAVLGIPGVIGRLSRLRRFRSLSRNRKVRDQTTRLIHLPHEPPQNNRFKRGTQPPLYFLDKRDKEQSASKLLKKCSRRILTSLSYPKRSATHTLH